MLLSDGTGQVLLVNPTYKPGWDLQGGMAEANEPPETAVARELGEELGLDITLHGLLVVDWVPPHGPWDDQIAFIFDGGTLDAHQTRVMRPRDEELSEAAFVALDKARELLRERLRNRLDAAIRAWTKGVRSICTTALQSGSHLRDVTASSISYRDGMAAYERPGNPDYPDRLRRH